jgi:hypothetical protein
MSLTVNYRGKYINFSTVLKKPQWLTVFLLSIGIVVWSAYYYSVIDAERAKVQNQLHNSQLEYCAQKDDLALLKDKAEHQLVVLQLKIGELQGASESAQCLWPRISQSSGYS